VAAVDRDRHSPVLMLSELEMHDLFVRYRSPDKA
jgi:hypothetical protein